MPNSYSFTDIRDLFINFERINNVYEIEIDEIFFWKLIRFELFNDVLKYHNIIQDGHPTSRLDKFKRLYKLIEFSLLNHLRNKNIKESDILVLTHGRKSKLKNDKNVDIYLDDFIEKFYKEHKKIFIIDRPDHYGNHYKNSYADMIYFERFGHITREVVGKIIPMITPFNNLRSIVELEKRFNGTFNTEINIVNLIKRRIFRFKYEKRYFDKLLSKVKPISVYLVASYGKEEMIASALERNIEVVEVQHGVINNYHMGYSFPFDNAIPYFPSKIILFGTYWRENTIFPINSTQEVYSFSHLKRLGSAPNNKEKAIVFISQGSIGDKLSKIASKFSKENKIKCYYKLHPSEFNTWRNQYYELVECEKSGFIQVVKSEYSIYDLFEICEYAIGVYSTSIYEALMYKCKVYLVNIQGYQYMEYLIKNNNVKLLDDNFSLIDIEKFDGKNINHKIFYR